MAALLSWTRPKTASDWEWQRSKDMVKKAVWVYTLMTLLIAIIAIPIVYRFFPDRLGAAITFLVMLLFGNIVLPCSLLLDAKSYEEYVVRHDGVNVGPGKGKLYRWRHVLGYRITDQTQLPGMRCLELTVGRLKAGVRCWFEPSEVDEAKLLAILQEHLPGKWLASTPEA